MKYLQIALVLAFLGIGEYVFVEYYPLSHTRRIEKFEKLPIVRSFVMAKNIRDVQKMIEKSDSGFVSIMRMNTSKRWYDAQSWAVDFEAGDLSAMRQMYWFATELSDSEAIAAAEELLTNHGSATADFYLNFYISKSVDLESREGALLGARMMKENYRPSNLSDRVFELQTALLQEGLEWFRESAENGDADAIWVLEQLDESRIETPSTE